MASKDVPRRESSRKRAHYGADTRAVQENFVKNFTSKSSGKNRLG